MTPQQSACVRFVRAYTVEHGYSPTYDEIKVAIGLKSKSGVNRLLRALADQRIVRWSPNRKRSIEVAEDGDRFAGRVERPTSLPDLVPALGAARHVVAQWRGGVLNHADLLRLEDALKRAQAAP